MEARVAALEEKLKDYEDGKVKMESMEAMLENYEVKMQKLDELQNKMKDMEDLKEDFADKLKAKLTQMEIKANSNKAYT